MSSGPRRAPPAGPRPKDRGGRPLLALFAVGLFVIGVMHANEFVGLPLFGLSILLLILFAFHSRIGGALGFGKFQVPIAAEAEPPQPASRQAAPPPGPPNQSTTEVENHRPSIDEYRRAARHPGSQRHRDR